MREKVSHFDHERIPERVVHARGAGAHGVFVANGAGVGICRAAFLAEGVETPVFVRFSTVLGSRGSADLARDTRGFATRFYTSEGNYDLVGNNIPVFFIQDGIKFPDVIHAAKPHPDREIPQAQSAHDTFWDFASLHTEAQAHTMWNMSDRGIPRSYRTMEGFGVHTFRMMNESGETVLVKFHWKPRQGVHSVTWEEAQLTNGFDPDFHRRDLADAIEAGAHPQWDFGVQVMPDSEDQTFEGIDLLDPTKIVPEELAPVQLLGTMTLTANPTNYFAETEQVAFNPANLAPGIDVTNDPLLQARLFSYLDTQITRLGGPNWNQLPINRAHAPINDMLRDGFHQDAVHGGVAPYRPNSMDGGCPFTAGGGDHPFIDIPVVVAAATKVRENPASFDDHFSQVTLFYRSLAPVEQDHVVAAYTFELSKCWDQTIRERQLVALANIDPICVERVADGLGLPAPAPTRAIADPTAECGADPARCDLASRRTRRRHRRRRRRRPESGERPIQHALDAEGVVSACRRADRRADRRPRPCTAPTPTLRPSSSTHSSSWATHRPPPTRYPPSMRRAAPATAPTVFAIREWSSCSRRHGATPRRSAALTATSFSPLSASRTTALESWSATEQLSPAASSTCSDHIASGNGSWPARNGCTPSAMSRLRGQPRSRLVVPPVRERDARR